MIETLSSRVFTLKKIQLGSLDCWLLFTHAICLVTEFRNDRPWRCSSDTRHCLPALGASDLVFESSSIAVTNLV